MYCKHSSIKANTQHVFYDGIWWYHAFCAPLYSVIYGTRWTESVVIHVGLIFPSDSSCTICVCSHQSVLLHRPRLSPLSETHRSTRPERCLTPLVDQRPTTRSYADVYFLTKVPGDDSLLRHSHNHPHADETAIWSNLGFSILPKNTDRTVDLLIREAVCVTSWVTSSPEKRRFSEKFCP